MTHQEDYIHANRKLWNTRTGIHVASRFYDVDAFKKGNSSLCGIEIEEMGSVRGKSVLHLQCHFGLDSLSLARLGAEVTGVDFSDEAIVQAQALAKELGIPARFLRQDVLKLPHYLDEQFDIVFTTFGVLGWLPDMNQWAGLVHHFLKPGGFLYLLEFHKFYQLFNELGELAYGYFGQGDPEEESTTKTYTDGQEHAPLKEYWWVHTMSDVVSAVLQCGLQIERFCEFPYCAYKLSDRMVEISPGRWVFDHYQDRIPYMFSIKAHRPFVRQEY